MNESQVNGTQVDEDLADETLADGGGSDGLDPEKRRRLRLSGFLRELVRAEGRMEAASLLGVNYKTLVRAEESGEITGRMGDALERLLNTGDDPAVARLRELVEGLAERMSAVEGGLEEWRGSDRGRSEEGAQAEGGVSEGGEGVQEPSKEQGAGTKAQEDHDDGAGRSETRAAPPGVERRPPRRARSRRGLDPEVVTEHPAGDDEEVYGAAWPLVEEWRRLRDGHPHQGGNLSWLVTQERLLTLELAMLEEHELTLPPETQALRGFGRRGQTSWRWKALWDTERRLARRRLLRWIRRVCTLGLWWK